MTPKTLRHFLHFCGCAFLFSIITSAFGYAMNESPHNNNKPIVAKLFVHNDNMTIEPFSITKANKGWLIVGARGKEAWASNINEDGSANWTYARPLFQDDINALRPYISTRPKLQDAVVLSNGTSILCGQIPRPLGVASPAIVVGIDKQGTVAFEKLIHFDAGPPHLISTISFCRKWKDGFLIVGTLGNRLITAFFGSDGTLRWKKDIESPGQSIGYLLLNAFFDANRDKPVLSLTDYKSTFILKFSEFGDIACQANITGTFFLIESNSSHDEQITLIGARENKLYGNLTELTLDRQLVIKNEMTAQFPLAISVKRAFLQSDGSIVIFGSKLRSDGIFVGAASHVDLTNSSQSVAEITNADGTDLGHFNAIAKADDATGFVVAIELLDPAKLAPEPHNKAGLTCYSIKLK